MKIAFICKSLVSCFNQALQHHLESLYIQCLIRRLKLLTSSLGTFYPTPTKWRFFSLVLVSFFVCLDAIFEFASEELETRQVTLLGSAVAVHRFRSVCGTRDVSCFVAIERQCLYLYTRIHTRNTLRWFSWWCDGTAAQLDLVIQYSVNDRLTLTSGEVRIRRIFIYVLP